MPCIYTCLQAPDLLGVPSALDLAAIAPEVVKNALRMKKVGNEVLKAIGGRSVHPVECLRGWFLPLAGCGTPESYPP